MLREDELLQHLQAVYGEGTRVLNFDPHIEAPYTIFQVSIPSHDPFGFRIRPNASVKELLRVIKFEIECQLERAARRAILKAPRKRRQVVNRD